MMNPLSLNTDHRCGDCVIINNTVYRIGALLNQGTDGRIYAVSPSGGSRDSAFVVKCFVCTREDAHWYSALKEIEAAQRLSKCRHTVKALGYCVREDSSGRVEIFILQERLLCCTDCQLSHEEIWRMAADSCDALGYMRRKGLLHGDVKPANLFRSADGRWQLGDFGCTQRTGRPLQRTGSAAYRAPEAYFGKRCDSRTDLYSLGITLYKLLSGGRLPFCGLPCSELEDAVVEAAIERRMQGEPVPLLDGASREENGILQKLYAFRPRDRYRQPEEAARHIRCIL